jgi:hypothetical protein
VTTGEERSQRAGVGVGVLGKRETLGRVALLTGLLELASVRILMAGSAGRRNAGQPSGGAFAARERRPLDLVARLALQRHMLAGERKPRQVVVEPCDSKSRRLDRVAVAAAAPDLTKVHVEMTRGTGV